MKKISMFLAGFVFIMTVILSCKADKEYIIVNKHNTDIFERPLVLSRSEVNQFIHTPDGNAKVYVKNEKGEWLQSQCDDIDGDGKWDELALLFSIPAGGETTLNFVSTDSVPIFPVRTNIRFGSMVKPFNEITDDLRMKTTDTKFSAPVFQMEGPAWENDLIAFRNYYDARNGMDIFGKRVPEMILDSVGVNGRYYHILSDWGMDILKVGNSLGAGAIAIGRGDSLYRVGPCEESRYHFITEGPVRAIFELTYKNVPAGDRSYNIRHQISIYAGQRFYRNKVWVEDLKGDEFLVTGIVNFHNIPADTFITNSTNVMFSLGNQAFDGEFLGMAILLPGAQFSKFWEAPSGGQDIVNTHLVSIGLENDKPAEYYFLAAWEKQEPQIKNIEFFLNILKEAAKQSPDLRQ